MHKMEVYLTNLHGSRRLNPAGRRPWSRSSPAPPESLDPAASAPLPVPGLASSSPRPPTSTRAAMDGRCVRIDCGRTRPTHMALPPRLPSCSSRPPCARRRRPGAPPLDLQHKKNIKQFFLNSNIVHAG